MESYNEACCMITVEVTNRLRGTGVVMASISLAKSKRSERLARQHRGRPISTLCLHHHSGLGLGLDRLSRLLAAVRGKQCCVVDGDFRTSGATSDTPCFHEPKLDPCKLVQAKKARLEDPKYGQGYGLMNSGVRVLSSRLRRICLMLRSIKC